MFAKRTDLKSYVLLTAEGWEWLTNLGENEAEEVLRVYKMRAGRDEYCIGGPVSTRKYSSDKLEQMGMLGLYRKGGHVSPCMAADDTPAGPVFCEPELLAA